MNAFRASLDRVWTIARRELKALFDHPTGYVLLIVFVTINAFLFFRQAYLSGIASLRPMMDLLPWVFLFFVPAVSMRTVAEDSRSGMLEVVLTHPLTEVEVLIGKFAGAVLFLWTALALTLAIPLGLTLGSDIQWGPVFAQYAGAALLAVGLAGVGVWASSLTRSQITAFILSVAVMFVLVLLGLDPLIVGLPPVLATIGARLGVLSHFEAIGRGAIDLRDVIYFLSLAAAFLALAYGALVSRKLSHAGAGIRRLRIGVALIAGIVIVVNLLGGYIGGRLDLSPGQRYTLSRATRQIVRNLDDIVTIKVYATDELPTSVALLRRDLDDLLRDLRSASRGNVRVIRRNPLDDESVRRDAQAAGIGPVQFNVIGQSELSVKEGYLGLSIQYRDGTESIPFVNRTDDLEYRVASAIRSLSRSSKPVVGMIDENPGQMGGIESLRTLLAKSYEVRSISLSDSTQPAADVVVLALGAPPDSLDSAAAERLRAYFRRGGSALVLGSGMMISDRMPFASPRPVAWNEILRPFGVSIQSDVAYDLISSEMIPASAPGGFRVLRRYPYFVRAKSTGKATVNQDLTSVFLPWPSTVDTTHMDAWTITPLFISSEGTGISTGMTMLEPQQDYPRTNLATRLLAVQVAPAHPKGSPKNDARNQMPDSTRARVIVVGNSEFVSGSFADHAPENTAFALNAIDWLAQDDALISIRSKDTRPPVIAFSTTGLRATVKYFNIAALPALIALAGVGHVINRRRKSRVPYVAAGARGGAAV